MKTIKLTKGQFTKVSDNWFEELNALNWYADYKSHVKSFYAARKAPRINGKSKPIYMHRVIANAPTGMQVDHIDGNTLNNQVENLRICTTSQNRTNNKKQSNNTSGFTGVTWRPKLKKWAAQIQLNKKGFYLGIFENLEDAAKAYDKKAKELFGKFARLNFSEE